jgi:hypothetical protein
MKSAKPALRPVSTIILAVGLIGSVSIFAHRNLQRQEPSSAGRENIKAKDESNGAKLPLKYKCLDEGAPDPVQFLPLPSGQLLVGICDALYMLDSQRRITWKYTVPQLLFDFTYIESTGLIYGTAGDNTMFILEASSGKQLVFDSRNGRAAYGMVKPYGNDQCLITDNFAGYREVARDLPSSPSMKDGLTAWRGTKVLWHTDFPPDADLVVNGSKILAVTKSKDGIFVKEIEIPTENKN